MIKKFTPLEIMPLPSRCGAATGLQSEIISAGLNVPQKFLTGFAKAKEKIVRAQKILLATHNDPDGDALGSMLALKIGLENIGKKSLAFCSSPIPFSFKFLPQIEDVKNKPEYDVDLIIGLDYGDFRRLELNDPVGLKTNFLTFDHHLIGDHLGLQIIENGYSSTSEIIYHFLNFLNIPIEKKIATCLLTGIFQDTGGFQHANASPETLKIAGELLLRGAPLQKITRFAGEQKLESPSGLKIWNKVFSQVQLDPENGLIFALISFKELGVLGNNFESPPGISSLLNTVPGAKIALVMTEESPNQIYGSLRTQKSQGINVAEIAKFFGGGGHKLAAGFQTNFSPQEIVEKIKNLMTKKELIMD